jgi:hypothetical protein
MHTADPKTLLGEICSHIDGMKPGQRLTVDRMALADIPSFFHNDAEFTPADRVLGNIVGSAFTHSYTVDHMNGNVTFHRHEDTGERRYEAPDRRR